MIIVENLTKSFSRQPAILEVNLDCGQNETVVVAGPSGCGKTTLLRLIAGLEEPDGGRISIEGVEVSSPRKSIPPHKRELALIFQDLALWPHMTVSEHIAFVLQNKRANKAITKDATEMILNDVSLSGYQNRNPHELSGGEQQRLAIARAIVTRPRYLLMDEPFSSLDSILKDDLLELLIGLKSKSGMGIICVTHNVEEAFTLADRIAIMNSGKVVQFDGKAEIMRKPANDFVRRLLRIG